MAHLQPQGQARILSIVGKDGAVTPPPIQKDLYSYIEERGYQFSRELVTRYLLAIHTRRLALLAGVSGTGKTKLALTVAEYFSEQKGTKAERREQPVDSGHSFFLKIDKTTLRSGTLSLKRDQLDYFNVPANTSEPFTASITNILGIHGDITFRVTNTIFEGRRNITIQVPTSVRKAFEDTSVTEHDYLHFEIVEEFKRFNVSLFRPEVELIDVPAEDRYTFVSVRPSWSTHEDLLGAWNNERETYERTPFLELLLRAAREEEQAKKIGATPAPYFIILDEMNLARIEHYFSDMLSVLESRRVSSNGELIQEGIHLHSVDAYPLSWIDKNGIEYQIPENFTVPSNVLITGTLNLDKSAHALSPKVVDRAHVISFDEVDFADMLGTRNDLDKHRSLLELPSSATRTLKLGEYRLATSENSRKYKKQLKPLIELNEILAKYGQHFGYRLLNDIGLFIDDCSELISPNDDVLHNALDAAIAQKIVPKFHGFSNRDIRLIQDLLEWCMRGKDDLSIDLDSNVGSSYTRSAAAIERMLNTVQ